MELIEGIFKVFGEIILWLFGIKKKQSPQEKNLVKRDDFAKAEQKPSPTLQRALPPVRYGPLPLFKFDPKDFFHWAGQNLDRWELLTGADVSHISYGKGTIQKVYRAAPDSKIIYFSIFLERDGIYKKFFVSDFNMPDRPFVELFVDITCQEEYQRSSPIPTFATVKLTDTQIRSAQPKEIGIQVPADLSNWKEDWSRFSKILAQHQVRFLYHFTDAANVPSIVQHGGLYSWWSCQNRGISIPKPGANDTSRNLDRRKGIHDYVHLAFNDNFPMLKQARYEGRVDNPVILKIDPEVIYWRSTLFSDINATANNSQVGCELKDFQKINFEIVTQPYYTESTKSLYQAEVLVKAYIPIQYILNI